MSDLIISSHTEINSGWLNRVLMKAGFIFSNKISKIDVQQIGEGKMGENFRILLDYKNPTTLPRSMILKLSSSDQETKSNISRMGGYLAEVYFYKEIASFANIRTPRLYYADIRSNHQDFVILMEDVPNAEPGNQLYGEVPGRAIAAITEIANLHASLWGNVDIFKKDYIAKITGDVAKTRKHLLETFWPPMVDHYKECLTKEYIRTTELFIDNFVRWNEISTSESTVIHGDWRSENMLFGDDGSVTTIDWQTLQQGNALIDVAYFIGGSMTMNNRRQYESQLLRHYHNQLDKRGVSLSQSELARKYQLGALHGIAITIFGASLSPTKKMTNCLKL